MSYDVYTEDLLSMTPGEALNATFWRLGVSLGVISRGSKSAEIDLNEILSQVEDQLFRMRELEK